MSGTKENITFENDDIDIDFEDDVDLNAINLELEDGDDEFFGEGDDDDSSDNSAGDGDEGGDDEGGEGGGEEDKSNAEMEGMRAANRALQERLDKEAEERRKIEADSIDKDIVLASKFEKEYDDEIKGLRGKIRKLRDDDDDDQADELEEKLRVTEKKKDELSRARVALEQSKEKGGQQPARKEAGNGQQQQQQQNEAELPVVKEWLGKNPWFYQPKNPSEAWKKTVAERIHAKMQREGKLRIETPEYFAELDKNLNTEMSKMSQKNSRGRGNSGVGPAGAGKGESGNKNKKGRLTREDAVSMLRVKLDPHDPVQRREYAHFKARSAQDSADESSEKSIYRPVKKS
ncbi:MAG: hypothetical protein ACXWYM_00355 [Candidatus Binatia bacterium]